MRKHQILVDNEEGEESASEMSSSAASETVRYDSVSNLILPVYVPRAITQVITGMMNVTLPMQFLNLNSSYALMGYMVAAQGLGMCTLNFPAGKCCSNYGPKLVCMVAGLLAALGSACCAVAPSLPLSTIGQRVVVGMGAFLIGSGDCFNSVAIQVTIAATVDSDIRGRAMSTSGVCQRIGMTIGPALAGLLYSRYGPLPAYVVQGVLGGVNFLWVMVFTPYIPPDGQEKERKGGGKTKDDGKPQGDPDDYTAMGVVKKHTRMLASVGTFIVSYLFLRRGRALVIPMIGHALKLKASVVGGYVSASFAVDGSLFPVAGWLLDKVGRNETGALSAAFLTVGFLVLLYQTPTMLFVFALITGVGNGIGSGIVQTMQADLAPPHARGPFVGVLRTLGRVPDLACPLIVGFVAQHASIQSVIVLLAGIGGASSFYIIAIMRRVGPKGNWCAALGGEPEETEGLSDARE